MYYIYIDEAGRGPIAWPVYVGIVIVKEKMYTQQTMNKKFLKWKWFPWVKEKCYTCYDDSKVLSEKRREELYEKLLNDKSIHFSSWSSKSTEVDKKWIVRSIRNAIAKSIWKYFFDERFSAKKFIQFLDTQRKNMLIIVDGKTDFHISYLRWVDVVGVVDGDAKIPMISAASIVAKVERDREMRKLHLTFPQYGFDQHKWYGSSKHYAAIKLFGISPYHRKTFMKSINEL